MNAITSEEALTETSFINLICLFDHEEIGSQSAQGAASELLSQNLKRIFNVLKKEKFSDEIDEIHCKL